MTLIVLISLAAFFTSGLTAAIGVGGGVILLALMAQVIPPAVLIPLHGAAQLMSNTNRVIVQRKHIAWSFIWPFAIGSVIGGALLAPIALHISPWLGQTALGVFILIATWKPQWLRLHAWHGAISGGLTTGLSLVLGATGPLVMSVLPKEKWKRQVTVGTHGMAMTIQHGIKVIAFSTLSFDLLDWWPMLAGIAVATLAGNIAGAKLLGHLEEKHFKKGLNWLLTVLAVRLIWQGLTHGLSVIA